MDAVARVDAVADDLAVEGPGPELVLLDVVRRAREEDLVADALGADVGACVVITPSTRRLVVVFEFDGRRARTGKVRDDAVAVFLDADFPLAAGVELVGVARLPDARRGRPRAYWLGQRQRGGERGAGQRPQWRGGREAWCSPRAGRQGRGRR